jgi:hypothetical protein
LGGTLKIPASSSKLKKKDGTSQKVSQIRGDQGDMMTKCHVVSWIGSQERKGHQEDSEALLMYRELHQ